MTSNDVTQTAVRKAIAATIDRLRDSGGIYAIDDAERDRIADELLPLFASERAGVLSSLAASYERIAADAIPGDRPDWYEAMADVASGLRRMAAAGSSL